MAQVLTRVLTCVTGSSGGLYVGSTNVRCSAPDGTQGIVIYKDVYLSDQPISAGSAVETPTPQNWLELGNMSMADAQLISGYIALLWAAMWGAKQIIRALFINERNQDE